MTEKQKREYIILGILALGIIVVIYFYFFSGSGSGGAQLVSLPSSLTTAGTLPDESLTSYLPYGPNHNLEVFNTPGYSQLVGPTVPTVSSSEVGESNPFAVIK